MKSQMIFSVDLSLINFECCDKQKYDNHGLLFQEDCETYTFTCKVSYMEIKWNVGA